MKALTWHGNEDVRVDEVPDARIQDPTDCVVRITSTGLCGSDLHLYGVLGAFIDKGDILGHEPMGVVEEVGPGVRDLRVGQRVVVPFNVSCGTCHTCSAGLHSQCETTQQREHGTGAALFGYTKLYGQVPGGQAELLRVPFADALPIPGPGRPARRPVRLPVRRAADLVAGGAVLRRAAGPEPRRARPGPDRRHVHPDRPPPRRGAGHRDRPGPDRLERARANGVTALALDGDVVEQVLELTEGRGPHAVIDASGSRPTALPARRTSRRP
jgi:threonine dehydrogenase-like Zn-dependent dehydrogenase